LQIIGHFDLDLPGTMPPLVKRMMEEALPKLQRLGDEYVPSDNWLGSCQQFRAILSIAVDGARGLQQGISAYYSKATHRS
jgi:hypothetical protein